MQIELHGTHGKRTMHLPNPKSAKAQRPQQTAEERRASDSHRKSAFATMRRLTPKLKRLGTTPDAVWDTFKAEYDVDSRSEFTTPQWAVIAARLRAADKNPKLLRGLAIGQ